ncbi:MAG TPA: FHA domain-containing protein [Candidatus Sulfomarinibacteraceae bacterium]|nr:FHA domain-containing protein [Candidatus Sulfomarinibacteraceae bacterium]
MAISTRRGVNIRGLFIFFLILCLGGASVVWAQEDGEDEETDEGPTGAAVAEAVPRIVITAADASLAPTVTLRAYGFNADGRPLAFNEQPLVVRHGGETIEQVGVSGTEEVGTFTMFLIDATIGVEHQIPAIQQAIEQYASSAYMKEQVDSIAIYRVGPEDATQALETTIFYNSVHNFFATPLEPQDGPTALIDSAVGLLANTNELAPNANVVSSLVIFSDGTDAVSTQFEPGDVAARAVELGIPVHTVWLENTGLTVGQEAGRNYLNGLAADAYGVFARLDQPETVTAIFERIIAFRDQPLLRYTVPELSSGSASVELSLLNDPTVGDQTEVTIQATAPTVSLNVPPDSRTLQLPSLEDPVRLALSADVAWLDGTERTVEQARFLVNGLPVQDVPVQRLERFEVEIPTLIYGDNNLQLQVQDDQGLQASSPPLVLTVVEGERQIPEALEAGSALLPAATPLCIGGLVLLALFGLGGLWAYRSGRLPSFPSRRPRRSREEDEAWAGEGGPAPAAPAAAEPEPRGSVSPGQAYLELLETETQMPSHIPLRTEETRLGRSPALADVAFEQDITVSRLHATILWDGHHYRLYDDDSTSGTWVNDQEVPDYGLQLFDGDDIYLGKVHLRFRQS